MGFSSKAGLRGYRMHQDKKRNGKWVQGGSAALLFLLTFSPCSIYCLSHFDSFNVDNCKATGEGSAVLTPLRFAVGTYKRDWADTKRL